ncbi:hypothetical protein ACFVZR_02680 [Streptomyces sp. NPDC058316]|uniref:hypothetical protein n=1 Tax=Streptomyces sp. NPDC058316 TaxID=3346442 RepID=UPI0036E22A04
MLTYQDVVLIKLDPLTTAAAKWDEMAKAFKAVEDLYKGQVQPVAEDGSWQGLAVGSAAAQFKATRAQLQGAQTEAKAMASLLRDAHGQFVTLCKVVTDTVARAVADDMSVNDKGEASYDFSKTAKFHNDPDYSDFVQKRKAAEQTWTKRIKDAVQAVDDADQGAQLAFRKAAGVKTGLEKAIPGMAQHGFNTRALGDIELYEAREAKEYADRILDGDKLSAAERAEWDRLYRDNADTKEFSRTLLDSLGPEKTIKLGNKLNDLAYFDDTGNKKDYLGLEKGLANTIAGATRVPEFKDEHGKPIAYGTKAYREKFDAWTKSDDASFYNDWRKGLQKAGVEQYDLEAAGEKIAIGRGHDQQIRGYQGLVTLMQQGDHYSPQFLADVTDDMIAAEKKDKNIWDLYGEFEGKNDGWFANDPVDGSLQIMSKDPVASTGYLDPGAGGDDAEHRTNDRLKYLMDRDTDLVNNTGWRGNIDYVAADTEDADAKSGLGAAIEAASTGSPAGSDTGRDGHHTLEQTRVMQDTIALLDRHDNAESVPGNMQSPLARALADYAPDTHNIFAQEADYDWESGGDIRSDKDGAHLNVGQASLTRMLRGVAEDPKDFAMLYEAERFQAAEGLGNAPDSPGHGTENWDVPARRTATGLGALNAIGADIILDDRDNRKAWADDVARYTYHLGGAPLTMIPGVGDTAQRVLDAATYEWSKDIKAEADQIAKAETTKDLMAKNMASHDLINQWADGRGKDYVHDKAVQNMRDEASQTYITARTTALSVLGRD